MQTAASQVLYFQSFKACTLQAADLNKPIRIASFNWQEMFHGRTSGECSVYRICYLHRFRATHDAVLYIQKVETRNMRRIEFLGRSCSRFLGLKD